MQYKQSDSIYHVYLEKSESVIDELTNLCQSENILNGQITGIGAVNDVVLGSYDSNKNEYIKKEFAQDHELISFNGNIMLFDDRPFIHAHCTIGNHKMELRGGHVFRMKIAVVGEFIIQKINNNAKRIFNKDIGLAVWDLKDE